MVNDELGKRMKGYYEAIPKTKLMRRVPVALRIDGKAFHTFTRQFNKPYDEVLMASMQNTMKRLCESIQGCVFGYTQSDEITLILIDYQKLTTDAWFGYEVQKMCSVGASMATLYFNQEFNDNYLHSLSYYSELFPDELPTHVLAKDSARKKGAMFDCRCFNIPKEEVANLLYWRQLDATRNSIQMTGQYFFSHGELHNKTCNDIQDMLLTVHNVNWNDLEPKYKRGSACVKVDGKWEVDESIPIFNRDWNYINRFIYVGEK